MTAISSPVERYASVSGLATYVVTAGAQIYKGALVCVDSATGKLVDGTATAALLFAGVAEDTIAGDGTNTARVRTKGTFTFAASTGAIGNTGKLVYLVDNNTVAAAAQTGNIVVGKVAKYNSSTSLDVDIEGYAGGGQFSIPLRCVSGTAAFTTTGTTKTVSAAGLTTIYFASVTPVLDAGAAAANGQLGFTEDGSTGLPEVSGGNATVNRVAGTDSGLKFVYAMWGT